jgi:hypothetical protein
MVRRGEGTPISIHHPQRSNHPRTSNSSSIFIGRTMWNIKAWRYFFLGPTLRHLRFEFALWVALTILTIANVLGLYQCDSFGWSSFWSRFQADSFGAFGKLQGDVIWGDAVYVALTSLWLGRHVLVKFWGTWDPTTHRNPSLLLPGGCFTLVIQSYLFGGQIFDRPTVDSVIRNANFYGFEPFLGSSIGSHPSASRERTVLSTVGLLSGGSDLDEDCNLLAVLKRLPIIFPSVVREAGNYLWVRLVKPLLDFVQHPRGLDLFLSSVFPSIANHPLSCIKADSLLNDERHLLSLNQSSPAANSRRKSGKSYAHSTSDNRMNRGGNNGRQSITSQSQYSDAKRLVHLIIAKPLKGLVRTILLTWIRLGPSVPFLLPMITAIFYAFVAYTDFFESPTHPTAPIAIIADHAKVTNENGQLPYGAYVKWPRPPWPQVFVLMGSFGTVASLLFYFRNTFPIPDQVAGGNVIRDVRTSALQQRSTVTPITATVTSGKLGRGVSLLTGWGANDGAAVSSSDNDRYKLSVWTEQHRSITSADRIMLTLCVTVLRILENILVVAILPRSYYSCRATGHCSRGTPHWRFYPLLSPAGVTGPRRFPRLQSSLVRLRINFWLAPIDADPSSGVWILLSVAITSAALLFTQAIVFNKAYLSNLAYVSSNDWILVEDLAPDLSVASATSNQFPSTVLSPVTDIAATGKTADIRSLAAAWDPRRRYKKGDFVLFPPDPSVNVFWNYIRRRIFQRPSLYQALVNNPESRPCNRLLTHLNQWLIEDFEYPHASRFVNEVAGIQIIVGVVANVIVLMWYIATLDDVELLAGSIASLLLTIIANWIAAFVILNSGRTNYSELHQIGVDLGR